MVDLYLVDLLSQAVEEYNEAQKDESLHLDWWEVVDSIDTDSENEIKNLTWEIKNDTLKLLEDNKKKGNKMRQFTAEQAKKIEELTEKLKGTAEYGKYYMSLEYKQGKKWEYLGWSIPPTNKDGVLKTYRGTTYIMYEMNGEQRRYEMTDQIKELFEI